MSLMDKLTGEFIDIIEWLDDSHDTLVYRFERYGNEIKFGAQLTVRQAQAAVFVNEGELADVFDPGMYTLETQNLPVLSTLQGWKYGFSSPFKAEVYFVSMQRFTDLKWGTKNPIILRDPEFGMVRVRAFGTYTIRVADPVAFITEIVGTDSHFTTDEITSQLRNLIVSRLATAVGQAKIPVLDMAANYEQLSQFIRTRIAPEFANYGLELTNLLVENISLPKEVEAVMDKRTSMGILGDLNKYSQFQMADNIDEMAQNPSGMAGQGAAMGMGFAMANQMANMMGGAGQAPQPQGAPAAAPPPLPQQGPAYFVAINGQQSGPFAVSVLAQMAQGGQVTPDSLVWAQGMAAWTAAKDVPQLAALFGAAPPPLPG